MNFLHYFGAALGLGMIVIGAGLGIGRFAAAAAEGIARQPSAADRITGAVNLPLFLLEGVAILAEVCAADRTDKVKPSPGRGQRVTASGLDARRVRVQKRDTRKPEEKMG